MTLNRVLGDMQGLGEKSGNIIQVEGPSRVEVDCEGSEGEKSKDTRLEEKAGTRSGRVLSSGSLRQNEDLVPAAWPRLYFRNKDFPTLPCLFPSKLCMYILR